MTQRVEQTHQEKVEMYMELEKEQLIEMLIEANRHLDNRVVGIQRGLEYKEVKGKI